MYLPLELSQPRRNLKPPEALESWEPLERSKQREQEVGKRVTQDPPAHVVFGPALLRPVSYTLLLGRRSPHLLGQGSGHSIHQDVITQGELPQSPGRCDILVANLKVGLLKAVVGGGRTVYN